MVNCNGVCQTILEGVPRSSKSMYLNGFRYCRRCELYYDMKKIVSEILPRVDPDQLHKSPNNARENRFFNINYCQCCGQALRVWGGHSQSKKKVRDHVRRVKRY